MSKRQKNKEVQKKETTKLKKRIIDKVLSDSRNKNVAFNLDLLVDGWLELESDPGTFSLLIEDFGCFGAQVEEVYDLEQKFDGPVFGFIFLFKWLNEQQVRNQKSFDLLEHTKNPDNSSSSGSNSNNNFTQQNNIVEDEKFISEIFFAKQMISNSCATHALISILLNCDHHELNLGPTLNRLKEHTLFMNPENKGYAIGNLPELAKAHNNHASYSSLYSRNKPSSQARGNSFLIRGNQRTNLQQNHEAYHFVSYVPINGRLYELDGLKSHPIDHGLIGPKQNWTEKFRSVIKQRLLENKTNPTLSDDIRFNLMAVVPDKRIGIKQQINKVKCDLEIAQTTIKQMKKQIMHPPNSPQSNGTLTASEVGSCCDEAEIARPPYSPISNDTLTASESGSACNSPHRNQNYTFDEESKVEKYFFVKFDSHVPTWNVKERNAYALEDLKRMIKQFGRELEKLQTELKEENDKRLKYKIDNSRRTHNYEPFIMTLLSMLAKQGNLAELIEKDLGLVPEDSESATPSAPTTSAPTTSTPKSTPKATPKATKPARPYKYVSTGRPRGRPRKNVPPS